MCSITPAHSISQLHAQLKVRRSENSVMLRQFNSLILKTLEQKGRAAWPEVLV